MRTSVTSNAPPIARAMIEPTTRTKWPGNCARIQLRICPTNGAERITAAAATQARKMRPLCTASASRAPRFGVVTHHDVVEALDVSRDGIASLVEVRVVEAVADALQQERGLLD